MKYIDSPRLEKFRKTAIIKIETRLDTGVYSMKKYTAFTLAEVLITLAIIGVVAALTIPTVITNYQKKMYVTQLKKSYNMFTNGFRTMMAKEGVTKLSDTALWAKMPENSSVFYQSQLFDESGQNFKTEFEKTFKIISLQNSSNYLKNYDSKIEALNAKVEDEPPGSISWFFISSFRSNFVVLADGTTLEFSLYKQPQTASCGGQKCRSLSEFRKSRNTSSKFWEYVGTISIDVNGIKGPNKLGRDYFNFFISNDGSLVPDNGIEYAIYSGKNNDYKKNITYWNSEEGSLDKNNNCSTKNKSFGYGCAARIMEERWEMKY